MTDEHIQKLIHEDIHSLSNAPHLWGSLSDVLELVGDDQSPQIELLKTLTSQNTIMIRQNELILRALTRTPSQFARVASQDTGSQSRPVKSAEQSLNV